MAFLSYYAVDGEVIGQQLDDGSRVDFMRDSLGSVVGTAAGGTPTVADKYVYSPSGAVILRVGTVSDPDFLFVGTAKYRATGLEHSDYSLPARHLASAEARWTTVDPLW